ncbi:hypothetical protein [Mongoliibacter ruber]|uniref:Uncharacterized protein n=1 Tax=Mongoliibacter ruber TaxID=1750599 RepID=A0A2T0WKD8_9BACT|nr:hypothetical protein [Mongoliibacter ruber]PRY87157.1 hypothetical protein CLW00_107227 [Mongoliibacter ruber]
MEILTSLLILLTTYFLAVLGLIQGFIPGASKEITNALGQEKEVISAKRVIFISFVLALFVTSVMVYFFIFPNYSFA